MESSDRKRQFAVFIKKLLSTCRSSQKDLAHNLEIQPSTLTAWLQGKVDPAAIEILTFERIASFADLEIDRLAQEMFFFETTGEQPLTQLKQLISEMLVGQSLDELSAKLGISKNTIKNWLNPSRNINPAKIPAGTIATLAQYKQWTIDTLLIYLGLKKQTRPINTRSKLQLEASTLNLKEKISFLAWLSNEIERQITVNQFIEPITLKINPQKILLILETQDFLLSSYYSSNLVFYLQLKPENLVISTIEQIDSSIKNVDLLIFDISTADSGSISFIEDLEFNGEIIIFAEAAALTVIRDRLGDCVSSIFSKPFDWSTLKSQPFFQRID